MLQRLTQNQFYLRRLDVENVESIISAERLRTSVQRRRSVVDEVKTIVVIAAIAAAAMYLASCFGIQLRL